MTSSKSFRTSEQGRNRTSRLPLFTQLLLGVPAFTRSKLKGNALPLRPLLTCHLYQRQQMLVSFLLPGHLHTPVSSPSSDRTPQILYFRCLVCTCYTVVHISEDTIFKIFSFTYNLEKAPPPLKRTCFFISYTFSKCHYLTKRLKIF